MVEVSPVQYSAHRRRVKAYILLLDGRQAMYIFSKAQAYCCDRVAMKALLLVLILSSASFILTSCCSIPIQEISVVDEDLADLGQLISTLEMPKETRAQLLAQYQKLNSSYLALRDKLFVLQRNVLTSDLSPDTKNKIVDIITKTLLRM